MGFNYFICNILPKRLSLEIKKLHSETKNAQCMLNVNCCYLTNRFHVAVHLSSNRSQMTSKCGKNKKVAHEAIAECVTDVLTKV